MSSPLPIPLPSPQPVTVRPAKGEDADVLVELAMLVDLHRPAEEVPAALGQMRLALTVQTLQGPLSHGLNHFLLAEDDGEAVGVIACGPPLWIAEHPGIPRFLRTRLVHRVSTIHSLAVRPAHRGRGIARLLLDRAEEDFRQAGYGVLLLRHERALDGFYRRLGFTSATRLVMDLPPAGWITQTDRGWKHA